MAPYDAVPLESTLDPHDLPLSVHFARGYAAYRSMASSSDLFSQETCRAGCASLRSAERAVRSLALFSRNEGVDDVATAHLKYLLVPFLQAEARLEEPASASRLILGSSPCCSSCSRALKSLTALPLSAVRCGALWPSLCQPDTCRFAEATLELEQFLLFCESYALLPARSLLVITLQSSVA
jgi:hypothetical protein